MWMYSQRDRCIISNALNWHWLEVTAYVRGTILFQRECLVYVLWKLTVALNCIFFFRCDLDKHMYSQQISKLCQTQPCVGDFLWGTGLQNEATSYALSLSLEVLSQIRWTDTWSGTKAWLWSILNQNSDIVRFKNRSTLSLCFVVFSPRGLPSLRLWLVFLAVGFLLGSADGRLYWCISQRFLKWRHLTKYAQVWHWMGWGIERVLPFWKILVNYLQAEGGVHGIISQ